MSHFCAGRQEAHALHEPKLLPPSSKRHSDLLLEQSFDGSLSRPSAPAELRQSARVAGIACEHLCDVDQPWIGQMRKLQRNGLYRFELMKNDRDQVQLPGYRCFQGTQTAGVKDQLLEQSGDIDDATIPGQIFCQARFQIQGSHRHQT